MLTMKTDDFKRLVLLATTIESLRGLGFHTGNSGGVLDSLYSEYDAFVENMSPADMLAFAKFSRGE